jgi:N-acetylneuraminic acid mutarotase
MKKRYASPPAFSSPRALIVLLIFAAIGCLVLSRGSLAFFLPEAQLKHSHRTLTFERRIAYQRAIEEVYWRHRIWPKERPDSKPSLNAVMSQAELEKKVADYLRKSQALEDYWRRPITSEQLQSEMDRMAKHSRQPEVLRELFDVLGNDPFVIAECLARSALADRLLSNWYAWDQRIHGELKQRAEADLRAHRTVEEMKQLSMEFAEIELVENDSSREDVNRSLGHGVTLNSHEWNETMQKLAAIFRDCAVATGLSPYGPVTQIKTGVISSLQEDEEHFYAMAVIDKTDDHIKLATASWLKEPREFWLASAEDKPRNAVAVMRRDYTLPTISEGAGCLDDTWTAASGPPDPRDSHTAVWTGSEMIVWGGSTAGESNTGGTDIPSTDTWTPTSTANAPAARSGHTAVWTGSEMIVWGGSGSGNYLNTGGRYNPGTDSWTPTGTIGAPEGRHRHTAVWTGSEMIVWGGETGAPVVYFNTGGRYNPSTDSWIATSTGAAPAARSLHTAIWTGSEMIVWGGNNDSNGFNTGGRYNPNTDIWTATTTANAPAARGVHTAVWTGSEMIIWGGFGTSNYLNTGGRYNPGTDSWAATSTNNVPTARFDHKAVWTGAQMIVWGGFDTSLQRTNSGGRYNPATDSWMATSTIDAPTAREFHTAVWTGREMIVWGGMDDIGLSNHGGRYNPVTNSWTSTGDNNIPDGRTDHTAVWTGSEMIVWVEIASTACISIQGENTTQLPTLGHTPPRLTRLLRGASTAQSGLGVK